MYNITDGIIYVKNNSYAKLVGIRLLDNSVWRDIYANYEKSLLTCGGNTIERWKLGGVLLNNSSDRFKPPVKFQFAAFYHNLENNTSYWDNNFGLDYLA
jgi:hypothetical protein